MSTRHAATTWGRGRRTASSVGALAGVMALLGAGGAAAAPHGPCTTMQLGSGARCLPKSTWEGIAAHACKGTAGSVTVKERCGAGLFAKATAVCCAALVCCSTSSGATVTTADACEGSALDVGRCSSEVCCDGPGGPATTTLAECPAGSVLSKSACQAPAAAFPVVDTAQDRCFDTALEIPCGPGSYAGQDAAWQGTAQSLVDNGDGTITDLVTGLTWQKDHGAKMTLAEAQAGAAAFALAGHTDWRLPTIKELYSLMRFDGIDPSCCETADACPAIQPFLDEAFFDFAYGDTGAGERLIDAQYASSTLYVGSSQFGDLLFGVNFADGRIKGYGLVNLGTGADMRFFVKYVRGAAYGQNAFVDNGDGTVTDTATGLTWLQGDSGTFGVGAGGGLDWLEALAWAEGLTHAGHDDWRLPTAKELQSLVDYTRSPDTTGSAAIDPVFQATPITNEGGGQDWGSYWTGTTHVNAAGMGESAVYVAFGRALGFMTDPFGNTQLMDVHGAGAQRSDPKVGDPADYPTGFGPQGDVIRIYNLVRPVRGGATAGTVTPTSVLPAAGENQCSGPGGSGGPGPGGIAMCGVVPPGLPCCGDGTCGGPETASNCPADC